MKKAIPVILYLSWCAFVLFANFKTQSWFGLEYDLSETQGFGEWVHQAITGLAMWAGWFGMWIVADKMGIE